MRMYKSSILERKIEEVSEKSKSYQFRQVKILHFRDNEVEENFYPGKCYVRQACKKPGEEGSV